MVSIPDTGLQIAGVAAAAASAASSFGGDVLQLDSIIFNEYLMEVPDSIGPVGGIQVVEEHRFPGGVIKHQVYGAFPEHIEWRGFFTGTPAVSRMQQVDLIRSAGNEVLLRYGQKAYLGRVSMFHPMPKHRYLIPYTVRFMPRIDLSSQVSGLFGSQTSEQVLAVQSAALATLALGLPFALPTLLTAPIASMISSVDLGLGNAGGVVASMSAGDLAAISSATVGVTQAAQGYFGAGSRPNEYMARSASYFSTSINNTVQYPSATAVTTLQLINPNLPLLAAQYLGNATKWTEIAYFNGLTDPQPIGSFTIKIPNANAASIPSS